MNVARLAAHVESPAFVVHGEHGARLEAAAEMRDSRSRADARNGS